LIVIVDTSVWSLALRRRPRDLSLPQRATTMLLRDLITADVVVLPGIVRQELLSGIRDDSTFTRIAGYLREFDDPSVEAGDYEEAARCFNRCLDAGVDPSTADMLICALALRLGAIVFTTDEDFQRYSSVLSLRAPTLLELQRELGRFTGSGN